METKQRYNELTALEKKWPPKKASIKKHPTKKT